MENENKEEIIENQENNNSNNQSNEVEKKNTSFLLSLISLILFFSYNIFYIDSIHVFIRALIILILEIYGFSLALNAKKLNPSNKLAKVTIVIYLILWSLILYLVSMVILSGIANHH